MANTTVSRKVGRPKKSKSESDMDISNLAPPDLIEAAKEALALGQDEDEVYATLIHDPFANKNPMKFLKHPEGKRLTWANPVFREMHGLRGLKYVTYDSEIGRNLDKYLVDPPLKMEGSVKQDNFVRRGDAILAYLPYGIWKARQIARVENANRQIDKNSHKTNRQLNEEAGTFGKGLQRDTNPRAVTMEEDRESGSALKQRGIVMPRENEES